MSNNERGNIGLNIDCNMLVAYVVSNYPCSKKKALQIIKKSINEAKKEQAPTYNSFLNLSNSLEGFAKAASM